MYLLPCPCGESLRVAASQAGNLATCPRCGNRVEVPTLGQLRQLPQASAASATVGDGRLPLWRRLVFAALAAIVMVSLAWSLFSLLKWRTTEVPMTMAEHIRHDRQQIERAPPAELARLWSEYETYDLYERRPFEYQLAAEERAGWRRMTLGSAGVAVLGAAAAAVLLASGRRRGGAI